MSGKLMAADSAHAKASASRASEYPVEVREEPGAYWERPEHIHRNVIPIQAAAADFAYDFPLAQRVLEEQGITFFVRPQAAHDRASVELKRDSFSYDADQDAYICPTGKHLRLNTLRRSASGLYWFYQADKRDCQSCPLRDKCFNEHDRRGARKLEHSYFTPERQRHLAHRYDADCKDALKKRQIWCKGALPRRNGGII